MLAPSQPCDGLLCSVKALAMANPTADVVWLQRKPLARGFGAAAEDVLQGPSSQVQRARLF